MNDFKTEFNESDLQAYVDGNVDAAESKRIKRYLDNHPDEAKRIEKFKTQNVLLKQLYSQTDEDLLNRIQSNYKKSRLSNSNVFISLPSLANVALLVVGILVGWQLNIAVSPQQTLSFNLPNTAMIAHTIFSPEVRHPVEVTADQEEHLVKWLSKRLNRKLKTPDLNPLGYSLIGGRLLPAEVGPAAQFMYENRRGERLTLYVIVQSAKDNAFQFFEKNNIRVFSWNDTNMGFAIVGSINKAQLLKAANKIYDDLII